MIKNFLVLPDGTEISYGAGNAIKTSSSTRCVNDGDELSLGSVCANKIAFTLYDVGGALSVNAGDEVVLYKVNEAGERIKNGVYILEKPTRPTANTIKLVGYDRVTKLDKDLTAWVDSLTGWPYTLTMFAGMVCTACGLAMAPADVPNADFPVYAFKKTGVTGRNIMKWLGEICCRFCRANADGNIEFAWYKPSGITITPTGGRYYFQRALSYETYQVAPVTAVQLRLASSSSGALWPEADAQANAYIITDNAILLSRVTDDLIPYLQTIEAELKGFSYTPCKVAVPACLDIDAGNMVDIVDKNGAKITICVMTKTTSGQKDTMECTGSPRRDSTTAVNNRKQSPGQAADDALAKVTQEQIFNKLTDNGRIQGIYTEEDKWYINAEVAKIINLSAESIDTTNLKVKAANIEGSLTIGQLPPGVAQTSDIPTKISQLLNDADYQNRTGVTTIVNGVVTTDFVNALGITVNAANVEGTLNAGQVIANGLTAVDVNFTGTFNADAGRIGLWDINPSVSFYMAEFGTAYTGPALVATWVANQAQTLSFTTYLTPPGVYIVETDDETQNTSVMFKSWWSLAR